MQIKVNGRAPWWALVLAVVLALGGAAGWRAKQRDDARREEVIRLERARTALVEEVRGRVVMARLAIEPVAQRDAATARAACVVTADAVQASRSAVLQTFPEVVQGGPWAGEYLGQVEKALRSYGEFAAQSATVEALRASGTKMVNIALADKTGIGAKLLPDYANPVVESAQAAARKRDLAQTEFAQAVPELLRLADGRPEWVPESAVMSREVWLAAGGRIGVNVAAQ